MDRVDSNTIERNERGRPRARGGRGRGRGRGRGCAFWREPSPLARSPTFDEEARFNALQVKITFLAIIYLFAL
jgi:hypothetical protein